MPQKKILTITLIDGRDIKRDITLLPLPGVPFGAPANDQVMQLCANSFQCVATQIRSR